MKTKSRGILKKCGRSFVKYRVGYSLSEETFFVFSGSQIFEKDLSETAATRIAQFLNSQEYLASDPKQRASKPQPKPEFNFDAIYEAYPRHEGKKAGLERLRKSVTSLEKFSLLQQALANYCQKSHGSDPKFIKLFSTWANCWEDYIPETSLGAGEQQVSFDDINALMSN